jgi:hypothetical protein
MSSFAGPYRFGTDRHVYHSITDQDPGPHPAGSVSQWYGFADPDPYQNVKDHQHCE